MNCALFQRHVDAFTDGEVDPTTQIEFEQHVAACAGCQETLAFEVKFREQVHDSLSGVTAPSDLRGKIRDSLEAIEVDEVESNRAGFRVVPMPARYAVPVAVAASAVLAFSTFFQSPSTPSVSQASTVPILEDVVRLHSSELPPDVSDTRPQQVRQYFRNKVAFPVMPTQFDRKDARFVGARLSNVRGKRAAALFYDVSGRRVTVVVFHEPESVLRDKVRRIRMHGRELFYQDVSGHTVPMRRHAGLTYAFTGDLDRATLMKLAASARVTQ